MPSVLRIEKNCVCVPTMYGKILNKLHTLTFWLAHNNPKIYNWLYRNILKRSHNYSILIRSRHII